MGGGTPGRGRSDRPTHGHSGAMGRTTRPLGSSRFGTGLGAAPWWGAGERISAQAPLIPCCCDGAGGGSPRPPLPSLGCSAHSESRGGGQGGPAWCPYGGGEAVGPPPPPGRQGLGRLTQGRGSGRVGKVPRAGGCGGTWGATGVATMVCVCVGPPGGVSDSWGTWQVVGVPPKAPWGPLSYQGGLLRYLGVP